MTTVALIPGINTPDDYPLVESLGPFITPHFAKVQLRPVLWGSTGTILGDVRRIGTDKDFTTSALSRMREGLVFLEVGDVIFAHSMGTVFVLQLMQEDRDRFRGIHVLLCGSPCSHAGLRLALRTKGFLGGLSGHMNVGRLVPHFWNRDDRVCALSQWASHPSYTRPIKVSIASRRETEHPAEAYLATPPVQDYLGRQLRVEPVAS